MARPKITLQLDVPRPAIELAAVDFEVQTLYDQAMVSGTNYDVDSPAWIGRETITLFIKSTADVIVYIWLGATKNDYYLYKSLDSINDFELSGSSYYWVGEIPMCVGMRITVSNTSTVTAKIIAS